MQALVVDYPLLALDVLDVATLLADGESADITRPEADGIDRPAMRAEPAWLDVGHCTPMHMGGNL